MRTAEYRMARTRTAMTATVARETMISLLGWQLGSDRLDEKNEPVAADDFHARSRRNRSRRAGAPDFAGDPHIPLLFLPIHRLAFGADQRLAPGHDRPPPR